MRQKRLITKAIALLLSVVMLLSIGTTAFATEATLAGNVLPPAQGQTDVPPQGSGTAVTTPSSIGIGTEEPTESEEVAEFDAAVPFTLDDLVGYSMEMDTAEIPIENFKLEGKNEGKGSPICELHFEKKLTFIKGGHIDKVVPPTVKNKDGKEHTFVEAHVGNTQVHYIGKLTIYDTDDENNEITTDYIYYTTDDHIDNKTAYAVLKEGEQISLVYDHGTYYKVDYKLQAEDDCSLPEGWTETEAKALDNVFGSDRAHNVAAGNQLGFTVTIPRGYQASVQVINGETPVFEKPHKLGEMMKYHKNEGQPNTIWHDLNTPERMILTESHTVTPTGNVTITVTYKKIDTIRFNAQMWTTTNFAGADYKGNRIKVKDSDGNMAAPTTANANLTIDVDKSDHAFTWEMYGIVAREGQENYTWEMDQFEINGEPIKVPMVTLNETSSKTATTTLSTGTEVTLTVKSGSIGNNKFVPYVDENAKTPVNGVTGIRRYTFEFSNCYEDLTVSGGNMVGHRHREFALHALSGFDIVQNWSINQDDTTGWAKITQNSLIDKKNGKTPFIAPFRLKLAPGFQNPQVTFTEKDGTILQKNDSYQNNNPYIQYLIRKDVTSTSNDMTKNEHYDIVPYANWNASDDGFYYCRPTEALNTFMKEVDKNGVILLEFTADPIKFGIDYQAGDGDGETAPAAKNIDNLPLYQKGGEKGYNILDNAKALVNNRIPMDKKKEFVFDHWEIMTVKDGNVTTTPKTEVNSEGETVNMKVVPGEDLHVSADLLTKLSDCLYYNEDKDRQTLTLRAVWTKDSTNKPIPYTVKYILADLKDGKLNIESLKLIEEHQHTVNQGAMLVTDLWQDGKKTLSANIQNVLKGANDNEEDYTDNGNVTWVVYEPKTTKLIIAVSPKDNEVMIYLVKQSDLPVDPEPEPEPEPEPKPEPNPNPPGLVPDPTPEPTPETGSLTVSKTVTGNNVDIDQSFTFTVTLGDTTLTGEYGNMTFADGVATFRLKDGETITASGLPADTAYTVKESDNAGYTVTATGDTGKITAGQTCEAKFINNKTDSDTSGGGSEPEQPGHPDSGGSDSERPGHSDSDRPGSSVPSKPGTSQPNPPDSTTPAVPDQTTPDTPDSTTPSAGTVTVPGVADEELQHPDVPYGGAEGDAAPADHNSSDSSTLAAPQTGDNSKALFWLALLAASGIGLLALRRSTRHKA